VRYEDKGPPTSPNRFEHAATSMSAAKNIFHDFWDTPCMHGPRMDSVPY
jgi:hypothetical protein